MGPNGVISGAGTISVASLGLFVDGAISQGVTVITAAGAQPSAVESLLMSGTLTVHSGGRVVVPVHGGSAGQFGSLVVTGIANLDGTLVLAFGGEFAPRRNDKFVVIAAMGGAMGAYDRVEITGPAPVFAHSFTSSSGQIGLTALNNGVHAGGVYLPLLRR